MSSAAKKRLLLVSDTFGSTGGVEAITSDLVRSWQERYDLSVMTTISPEAVHASTLYDVPTLLWNNSSEGPLVFEVPEDTRLAERIPYQLWRHHPASEFTFDVVLALKEGWPQIVAQTIPAPIKLAWMHSDPRHDHWTEKLFGSCEAELEILKSFTHAICVGEELRDAVVEIIGNPENLIVRANPIPVDEIRNKANEPLAPELERTSGTGNPPVRFVMLGRLKLQKGYEYMLDACKLLNDAGYSERYEVLVAGSTISPMSQILFEQQAQLDLSNVHFIDELENPYPLLASTDWYLSTSSWEGYSISMQEAAVLGIPMILTPCSGVREFTSEGENGTVVEQTPESIAAAMKRAIDEPSLREHYAAKTVEASSSIDHDERLHAIEALWL